MLTIGAFARASRLSPKALRLYDELGLLRPAVVDPVSGYRYYRPEQLERARRVAWLRRLGMPLARIKVICELDDLEAAREVAGYWRRVESETRARAKLAAFLIDYLSGKEVDMSPLTVRCSVLSDRGQVRPSNQDAAYAGPHLFAVADGFGGEAHARPASVVAIEALKRADAAVPAGDLLNVLEDAARGASTAIREMAVARSTSGEDGAGPTGGNDIGTTLTALLWSGSRLALVHVGDSRAYLLRDGELFQISHDHTQVQAMIEEGRLTPAEATSHPQRALLLRALTGGPAPEFDLDLHQTEAGDRYLLCSDGLHTTVPPQDLHEVMSTAPDPAVAVRRLVDLANAEGGPDNIACVVADLHAA
jgi:serine/threonine protein phosphatase PrpC/DNA-binding transcriptional MerR regulator